MTVVHDLFITCAKGMEELLVDELRQLSIPNLHATRAGVAAQGELADAYRICLWSRLASRVLLKLGQFTCSSAEALYAHTQSIAWDQHMHASATLAVDFVGTSEAISHSHFGALKVKDAIVDQFRDNYAVRPSIDTIQPDIRINVYLNRDQLDIALDLSGDSLHRRGYRSHTVAAPLKENLASAILIRAQWPKIAETGGGFVDLMCGSGTFCIEAALMAADMAPGLTREYFGFLNWQGHDDAVWQQLRDEAQARSKQRLDRLPDIGGYDSDAQAIHAAKQNAHRAGLDEYIHFQQHELGAGIQSNSKPGLVIANPPYGHRLGSVDELTVLYRELGETFKRHFEHWQAAVFTGNPQLGRCIGLRPHKKNIFYNGALECKLFQYRVSQDQYANSNGKPRPPKTLSAGATMFANRLTKNLKHYRRWATREAISAYRVYDADMPEYNLAIDLYQSDSMYAVVQEYEAPKTIDPEHARQRLSEALVMTGQTLQLADDHIFFKQRRRQTGGRQYEKLDERQQFHEIREGTARLLVNFSDYLDTGLFLDHRLTRQLIGRLANAKRFLNLFAYTGTATIHAALGGAVRTTSVDMSNTYLAWARQNLALNDLASSHHELIQDNVLSWLKQNNHRRYDLIFLDPPSFSRSKRMQGTLDIQRDHVALLHDTMPLLAPQGTIIFSTNLHTFKFDQTLADELQVTDISAETIPKDFVRHPKIHHCFQIQRRHG